MVKFEIIYSGAGTKINLSDGRTLKLKDGQKFLMPMVDWKTFKNSDNFELAGGDKRIKEKKEEPKKEIKKTTKGKGGKTSWH